MLRGEQQNELVTPRSWIYPHSRNYQYVEQVFKVPLWYIETLSIESSTEPENLWNRYIASSPDAAIKVLQTQATTKASVYVLLPGYMVQQNDPVFTRCRTLWRCCVIENKTREVVSFVTDIGEFVDYQDAVEVDELHKIEQIWCEH